MSVFSTTSLQLDGNSDYVTIPGDIAIGDAVGICRACGLALKVNELHSGLCIKCMTRLARRMDRSILNEQMKDLIIVREENG